MAESKPPPDTDTDVEGRPDKSDSSTARTVGLGFLFILMAKGYFLIAGFAVQFGLPRLFLRAARLQLEGAKIKLWTAERMAESWYGDYGVASRTISWINNTMVQGTIQAVSKFVAEDEDRAGSVKAAGIKVQAVIGGVLAATYFALSGPMARLLSDPNLTPYFRVTAIIILAYALYAVFIGYLNGLKRFKAQASFDVTYSTIKSVSILVLAFLGYGVAETLGAFSGAAVVVCMLAAVIVGVRNHSAVPFHWQVLVKAMVLVVVYYIFFNSLLIADIVTLKGLAGRVGGVDPGAAAAMASALAGIYNGVLNLALLPYQGVLAVAFVIFPLISRSTFDQDHEATRTYIEGTLRYALVFVGFFAVCVASTPEALLALLNPSFAVGAPALRIYVAGEVFFALFAICNTIIIASGRMGVAAVIAAVVLALDLGSNLTIVPAYIRVSGDGLDPAGLTAAAAATAPVFVLAFLGSLSYLRFKFGALLAPLTALRVLGCGAGIVYAASFLPRLQLVPSGLVSIGCAAAYLVCLVLLREVRGEDLARIKKVARRKKSTG